MIKEWYFIRHGVTDYNEQGIVQGSGIDSEINSNGIRQARAFYEAYQEVAFDKIITSALRRTRQTVHPFIKKGIPIYRDASINEINWGIYEGMPASKELKKAYHSMISAWSSGNFHSKVDQGESAAELAARLKGFIERLNRQKAGKVLICTHGRTMRCMMALISGGNPSHMEQFKHANTGLYKVISNNGQFHIELNNDTRHLSYL